MNPMARRMFELVEPIGMIPYSADEPNEAMFALGFTNYWDTYFAGPTGGFSPLGYTNYGAPFSAGGPPPGGRVSAGGVAPLFYTSPPGGGARHIPSVWATTTPEAAIAARRLGCANALRRILGDHV